MRGLAAILGALQIAAVSAAAQSWRYEAESDPVRHHESIAVVADEAASGGHILVVPPTNVPQYNLVYFGLPPDATPGSYRLVCHLQGVGLADVGKGWRIDVRNTQAVAHRVVYGVHLRANAYTPAGLDFAWHPRQPAPAVYMRWSGREGQPTMRLDAIAIERLADPPPARIVSVWPDRLRYRRQQQGKITVLFENLGDTPVSATVKLEIVNGLDRIVASSSLSTTAEVTGELVFPFVNPGQEYGYTARAELLIDGQPVDQAAEYFTVHDNPWAVATGSRDEELAEYYSQWQHVFYSIGATDAEIAAGAMHARKEYVTCTEFFSWSPGECFDMAPASDFWIRGNGGDLLRSKREIQRQVAALQQHGIGCITYVAQQAMGEKTVAIHADRPDWFSYSAATGDLVEFYRVAQLQARETFWQAFDWADYRARGNPDAAHWQDTPEQWAGYEAFWTDPLARCRKLQTIGYFVPNYALPEVVDYCADQVLASVEMFGWDGLRWDCGHLNPGPIWRAYQPLVDVHGEPLTSSVDDLVTKTNANLRRLKSRIRAQHPDFVFGTNFGSWAELNRFPEMTAELARDGGWLLDEVSYGYNQPSSPYHYWRDYYAVMADAGEYVTRLGGHYHPFAFNRNGGKYPVDRLYETVIRIAGHGHPNAVYCNGSTSVGNLSQFCVRFGRFVFDPAIRRVADPQAFISVDSAAGVWWQKTVGRLQHDGAEFLIVHLINPPLATEIETDEMSRLPAPIDDLRIHFTLAAEAQQVDGWVLGAEAWTSAELPKTEARQVPLQRAGNRVTLSVPELLYWKMVVLRVR